jgi:hypothetical protein
LERGAPFDQAVQGLDVLAGPEAVSEEVGAGARVVRTRAIDEVDLMAHALLAAYGVRSHRRFAEVDLPALDVGAVGPHGAFVLDDRVGIREVGRSGCLGLHGGERRDGHSFVRSRKAECAAGLRSSAR